MKALELLKEQLFKLCMSFDGVWISTEKLEEIAKELEKIVKENSEGRLVELETPPTIEQTKTVTSTHSNLIFCPLKNTSCILSKCAAYTTHKEPDIMKCDSCGDTYYRGQRCKNYIKGKPEHIKMSLYKNMAYCKHFKCHVFI